MSVYTTLNLTIQPGESGFERVLEFLRDRFCAESERPSGSVEADGAVIELTTEDAIKYVVGDDDCGAGMEELKALLLQLEQISPGLQCQGKWNVTFATSGGSDEWSFKWKTGEFRNVINESEEQLMEGLDEKSVAQRGYSSLGYCRGELFAVRFLEMLPEARDGKTQRARMLVDNSGS